MWKIMKYKQNYRKFSSFFSFFNTFHITHIFPQKRREKTFGTTFMRRVVQLSCGIIWSILVYEKSILKLLSFSRFFPYLIQGESFRKMKVRKFPSFDSRQWTDILMEGLTLSGFTSIDNVSFAWIFYYYFILLWLKYTPIFF
jgi:hypothetical protein